MELRDKIIHAATKLLIYQGLKQVTMDDVAASIGISKRTIYENFSDKKELISACVGYIICQQEEQELVIIKQSSSLVEELFTLFSLVDEDYKKRDKVALEIKKYYPDIFQEHYTGHYEAVYDKMCNRLRRGIAQGIILPETNVNFAVYVILETLHHLMISPEKIIKTHVAVLDAFKYVIIYFFRGISTQRGIELIDAKIASKTQEL